MSKTTGNCVWLNDEPNDMFGKLMSVPDDQIVPYLELCSEVSIEGIRDLEAQLNSGANPKDVKARMARAVTEVWHGAESAKAAEGSFTSQFSQGELPSEMAEFKVNMSDWDLADLLVSAGLASSKSDARRLIEQGGVRLNQQTTKDTSVVVHNGDVLQAGKRRFIRIHSEV